MNDRNVDLTTHDMERSKLRGRGSSDWLKRSSSEYVCERLDSFGIAFFIFYYYSYKYYYKFFTSAPRQYNTIYPFKYNRSCF